MIQQLSCDCCVRAHASRSGGECAPGLGTRHTGCLCWAPLLVPVQVDVF